MFALSANVLVPLNDGQRVEDGLEVFERTGSAGTRLVSLSGPTIETMGKTWLIHRRPNPGWLPQFTAVNHRRQI
jgi:hypothetical protein